MTSAILYFGNEEARVGIVLFKFNAQLRCKMQSDATLTMSRPLMPMIKSNHGSIGRLLSLLRRT